MTVRRERQRYIPFGEPQIRERLSGCCIIDSAARRQKSTVRRNSEVPDFIGIGNNRRQFIASSTAPEIAPFEAAQIDFTCRRRVILQQFAGATYVSFLDR